MTPRRTIALVFSALLAALALAMPAASSADAPLENFSLDVLDGQAGGHPDLHVSFDLTVRQKRPQVECECNYVKDIIINTPPGLLGIPTNMPRCTAAEFSAQQCPIDSQIGVSVVQIGESFTFVLALYNMVPRDDQAGLIAIDTPLVGGGNPIYTSFTPRTESDYGLEAKTFSIPRTVDLSDVDYIFWGVPGDPVHDVLRFGGQATQFGCSESAVQKLLERIPACGPGNPVPFNSEVQPFISMPTNCAGERLSTIDTLAYDLEYFRLEDSFPALTGCSLLSFNPSQSINPTTLAADSPSGAEFVLDNPQPFSPSAPTPSQLREANVTLPEGFTVAPNLTNGKDACTDVQAKIGSREEAECPEASKIGLISVDTPALPGPLDGAAWLGEPKPGDRYRLLFTFDGFGFHVKLPGSLILDRSTGQMRIRFANLPEAPFARFTAHFFGAERGPLATPTECGTYEVRSVFTPWAEELPEQTSRQFFVIDAGPDGKPCPGPVHPFAPSFSAGTTDNTAAAHTPFSLDIVRGDGDQNLSRLEIATPPGFTASLAGIPYCSESAIALLTDPSHDGRAEAAVPACPAVSHIGHVKTGTGAGTHPLFIDGHVYLAGPYKGAPLSFLIVVPAVSGPYDLGTVAVRAAVYVDPVTAEVTTVSDPLPRILEGIPLRLRQVRIDLDRSGFILNPTNCDPFSIEATMTGDQGSVAVGRSHYQVANCADLPFRPKLSLRLSGGVNRRGHPAIRAVFRPGQDEANVRALSVTLPKGELLDNSHIGTVCTRAGFSNGFCPESSRIGRAQVTTPLLDQPLRGTVYLRSSSHDLPDIAIALHGQVDFELALRVDTVNGRLRTRLENGPDIPVSEFVLNLAGGRKGLLQNTESLCGKPRRATTRMVGQNGVRFETKTKLDVACGGKKRHKRNRAIHRARRAVTR